MKELDERILDVYQKTIIEGKKKLSVPEKHQLNIAKKTLKMSDAGANIMGGMSKKEAREFLSRIGYSDKEIKKMEEDKDLSKSNKEINEASEVAFDAFDDEKKKFIESLVGKSNVKNQQFFDGIHGKIVNFNSVYGNRIRVDKKALKKIMSDKNVRWIDIVSIGL
jgi:hypothetical protein